MKKTRSSGLAFVSFAYTALLLNSAADAAIPKASKVLAAAQSVRTEQLQLLEQIVNIDSGTGDTAGGTKVIEALTPRLQALGMSVESVPAEAPGLPPNTVATLTGTGKGRILMIGHIDTVFEAGTAQRRPYHTDDKRAYGPGVTDEKGGVIEGLYALELLQKLHFREFQKIVFLIETSEELGSPGTHALIKKLLGDADVEFNLEPGDEPDAVTVWRKGSATFYIDVKGRAAHAGIAPQDGRNAALELIHQIQGLEAFPHSGDGVTVNLTVVNAGTRSNIIPEEAAAQINMRARVPEDFDKVEAVLRKNAETTIIPDTKVTVRHSPAYPPLPDNPATRKLAALAQGMYKDIGRKLDSSGNGGASESALAAEAGVPALDGLGPVGGGFHSEREFADLDSVTPRLYLLTELLMRGLSGH
jgi:glutamate carboxypeptidase